MNDLITKVIAWANERNIIQGSTAIKQLDKTSEEFIKKLFAAEIHWLEAQDSTCHTVEEAARIR